MERPVWTGDLSGLVHVLSSACRREQTEDPGTMERKVGVRAEKALMSAQFRGLAKSLCRL